MATRGGELSPSLSLSLHLWKIQSRRTSPLCIQVSRSCNTRLADSRNALVRKGHRTTHGITFVLPSTLDIVICAPHPFIIHVCAALSLSGSIKATLRVAVLQTVRYPRHGKCDRASSSCLSSSRYLYLAPPLISISVLSMSADTCPKGQARG